MTSTTDSWNAYAEVHVEVHDRMDDAVIVLTFFFANSENHTKREIWVKQHLKIKGKHSFNIHKPVLNSIYSEIWFATG